MTRQTISDQQQELCVFNYFNFSIFDLTCVSDQLSHLSVVSCSVLLSYFVIDKNSLYQYICSEIRTFVNAPFSV